MTDMTREQRAETVADARAKNEWPDLVCPELRGANLRDAELRALDMPKFELRAPDMLKLNLRRANLRDANLRGMEPEDMGKNR